MLDPIIDFLVELFTEGISGLAERLRDRHQRRSWRVRPMRQQSRQRQVAVPDLRDLPVYEARHCLASAGLRMNLIVRTDTADKVKGIVIEQMPAPGQIARRRSIVSVHI